MTNFQKLKHDARRAEQRSDWQRAIELYRRALDFDAETVDLSIYNRIGDLHMRQGETAAAVECYEQAADRYAEQGMHTSAIALCNKVLRIAPDRDLLYRQLGGLHAKTGLLAEGRRCCMIYVDRALEGGRLSDAREAVEEFATASGDEPIRLTYAERLEALGDAAAAAVQLRSVYQARVDRGSEAKELLARIQQLDPDGETATAQPAMDPETVAAAGSINLAGLVSEALAATGSHAGFDPAPPAPQVRPASSSEDEGLEGVRRALGQFRAQVANALPNGDPTLRYDLGVEFMTIGLIEEAVEEFQIAIQEPALMEAATARLAECLVLNGTEPWLEIRSTPAPSVVVGTAQPESASVAEAVAEPTADPEPVAEPEPVTEPEPVPAEAAGDADVGADSSAGEPSDELSGHYFRARLAQYRIRRAEERHTTDHAAHAELGTAYAEMDLVQEAVREFAVALKGPRPVAARAVRALRSLTRQEDTLPELVLHVIDNLSQAGFSDAADELAQTVADQWGTNHPLASRLDELRLHIARSTEQLPELESLFPTIATDPAVETEPPGPVRPDSDRGNEHLRELGELLAEIDAEHPSDEVDDALRTDDGHLQALRRVDEYCAAGQMEEAEAALYALLDELQEAHRAREAMIVLDRLLVLRPDDVVLYHQKTELALMVNDRRSLLAAYAELGACLRRQGADRSARTAFGRILDFDPTNEAARAAIAEIDRDEIQLESRAATRKPKARRPRSRTSDADRAAFDLMLDDLGMDDGAEPEGQALGTGDSTGSPDGDPKSEAMSRLELGLAFRQMGMWDEAVDELRAAAPRLDDPSTLLEALGESLHQAGRNDEAVAELEPQLEDLEDDGPMVGALYFLAQAFRAEGRDADARKALARVEAASPGYRDTPQLLSELSQ